VYAVKRRVVIVQQYSCLAYDSRPLYFARVDIKSCFDTIDQEKLLNIMYRMIQSEEYVLHKYCEVNMDQGKVRKRFNIRASAIGKVS